MFGGLGINMVEIESARSLRERPTNPDAFDLILQARALRNLPSTPQRQVDALALYERALLLDPTSSPAMAGAALLLLTPRMRHWYWDDFEVMRRTETLTTQALTIAPMSQVALASRLYLLRVQERWKDAIAAAQRFVELFPNDPVGYRVLGLCKTFTGNAEEGIALAKKAIQISPRSSYLNIYYHDIGFAALMLGRDHDAIAAFDQSLVLNPDQPAFDRQDGMRQMAAAYARIGEVSQAHRWLAEANRLFPFDTVRGHWPQDPTNAVFAQQIRSYQDGLRQAGLRDHADEDADFGVTVDADLHQNFAGLTPIAAPGAQTIRTADLVTLLAERKPVVIDVMSYFWGTSIPGAVALKEAGAGGRLTDPGQDRLRRKISELTAGDLSKPIVAVGWNSERFDGRNLALRLAAMGYTNVYWYRGGREAWEANGLPEGELTATDW
jgi:tetratricopeptide (TPR) repeat protein